MLEGMTPMANSIPDAATGSKSTSEQKAFIRALLMAQDPAGYISLCKVIVNAEPPDYAAIQAPFIIIAGEEDKSAPLDGCKEILEGISSTDKKIVVLDGVGHWHCVEAADQVGKIIAGFCEGLVE